MINIGIIGCGKIAQIRHIPELLLNPKACLKGFYDINQNRANELAKTYNGKAYVSYKEMLDDKEIDAVIICTANQFHASISIEAMKNNKHVLCEKPMGITLEECYEMINVAKEKKVKLCIAQNQRLTKAHIRAKELLGCGAIGDLVSFRTTFGHSGPETWSIDAGKNNLWFFNKELANFGAMGDLGIHKTDLISYLTGLKFKEVIARITTLSKKDDKGNYIEVDDNAFCIFTLENNVVGTMYASWTFNGYEDNSTILYGTKGIMKIYDDPNYSIIIEDNEKKRTLFEVETIQTNDNQTSSGIVDEFINYIETSSYSSIAAEYIINSMEAVFASVESSNTNKAIKI